MSQTKIRHETVGGNFRLDALQAAILRIKLPHLEQWTHARIANAAGLRERLAPLADRFPIQLPVHGEGRHVYNQFVIRTTERDALKEACHHEGIQTAVYYPKALHQQECFRTEIACDTGLPEAEKACGEVLALPVFPGLTERELDRVGDVVSQFFKQV